MLNARTFRLTLPGCPASAFAALACLSASAHAALLDPNCSGPEGTLSCRLTSALHVLYVVAAILGVVLLAVIALAIRIYRQNSAESGKKRP